MKISAAVLLLALTAAPVLAAPPFAPRAQGSVLMAFSGQADAEGQPGATGQNGASPNGGNRNGTGQDDPSGRSGRVIIKGKGGKVTGVERKPDPGGERDTRTPPRQ
jgi:hypothetical protein